MDNYDISGVLITPKFHHNDPKGLYLLLSQKKNQNRKTSILPAKFRVNGHHEFKQTSVFPAIKFPLYD